MHGRVLSMFPLGSGEKTNESEDTFIIIRNQIALDSTVILYNLFLSVQRDHEW